MTKKLTLLLICFVLALTATAQDINFDPPNPPDGSGERIYNGKNIYVGNSVTDNKPTGDVIISNNADVEIKANKTILDKGFRIEKGATLKISK